MRNEPTKILQPQNEDNHKKEDNPKKEHDFQLVDKLKI